MFLTAGTDGTPLTEPYTYGFARATTIVDETVEDPTNLWDLDYDETPGDVVCLCLSSSLS